MRKRRRVLLFFVLCLSTLAAYGQQSWQGNAAVARSGEFASPGLYAASNAFPENTSILVQNAQTGQSVRVTVARRIQGTASIFLLLSEEAGQKIGLSGSQVIRVQARVVATPGTDLGDSLREQAYSNDPDLNPPVSVAEEQLSSGPSEEIARAAAPEPEPEAEAGAGEAEAPAVAEQAVEPVEESAAEAAPAEEQPAAPEEEAATTEAEELPEEPAEPEATAPIEPQIAAEEQPAEQESAGIAEEPAAAPTTAPLTPEEKRLEEVADRIPQKQLYMPPRQQEVYALAPEPAPAEEAAAAEEQPPAEEVARVEEEAETAAEPEIAEVEAEEEGPPRVSMLGPEVEEEPLDVALPGPEATEPEKPSPEGTRLPAPEEERPLTMAPEEPPTGEIEETATTEEVVEQPVEEQPEAEIAMAEAPAEEAAELSGTLPSRTYFVQLGAYSTRNLAEKLAGDLPQGYSVTILPASSGGRRFYKVLVGPLNVDESGTLLYQFRSRGFKDAFIQYVE